MKSDAQVTPASLEQARNLGRTVSDEAMSGCSNRMTRMCSKAVLSLRATMAMMKGDRWTLMATCGKSCDRQSVTLCVFTVSTDHNNTTTGGVRWTTDVCVILLSVVSKV